MLAEEQVGHGAEEQCMVFCRVGWGSCGLVTSGRVLRSGSLGIACRAWLVFRGGCIGIAL